MPDQARNEAAFHHAGHAVATHLSAYHVLAAPITVRAYGTGEISAALSRRKLHDAQKAAALSSRTDPDVVAAIVRILCAGLASEQIAAARGYEVVADPSKSDGDFTVARAELALAALPEDLHPHLLAATELLTDHWPAVERIATHLLAHGKLEPEHLQAVMGGQPE